jgi:cytoskeletal protein RodZ
LAYDFSLFEPQPKYTANIIKIPKHAIKKRNKFKLFVMNIAVGTSLIAGSLLVYFVHGQVKIAEITENILELNQSLAECESLSVQLKMKKEKLIYDNKTKNKPSSTKIEYILHPQSDKSEIKTANQPR